MSAADNSPVRVSIEVDGLHHGAAPIPAASVVGGLLASSAINGMDAGDGSIPADLDEQAALVFENIGRITAAAGSSPEAIVKCTFFVRDKSARAALDPHWRAMFPLESSRPARHVMTYEGLPGPVLVQAEILAVVGPPTPGAQRPNGDS